MTEIESEIFKSFLEREQDRLSSVWWDFAGLLNLVYDFARL